MVSIKTYVYSMSIILIIKKVSAACTCVRELAAETKRPGRKKREREEKACQGYYTYQKKTSRLWQALAAPARTGASTRDCPRVPLTPDARVAPGARAGPATRPRADARGLVPTAKPAPVFARAPSLQPPLPCPAPAARSSLIQQSGPPPGAPALPSRTEELPGTYPRAPFSPAGRGRHDAPAAYPAPTLHRCSPRAFCRPARLAIPPEGGRRSGREGPPPSCPPCAYPAPPRAPAWPEGRLCLSACLSRSADDTREDKEGKATQTPACTGPLTLHSALLGAESRRPADRTFIQKPP